MAVKRILMYPQDEDGLRKKSAVVARKDASIPQLIQDLRDTLATQDGAGLAAPQIGIHKRVALVVFGQDEGEMQAPFAIINPIIIKKGPLSKGFDGCLSLPNIMTWDVLRPEWLVFSAYDEHWNKIKMRVEGTDARVVSHEIDHLHGIFFLDYLSDDDNLYIPSTNDAQKLLNVSHLFLK